MCAAMRSVSARAPRHLSPSAASSRSRPENGCPKTTVTRERNAVLRSKLRPTGTSVTRVPARSAASAMRAAPGPQRLEPAGRVADPLGKDTDRVPGREGVGHGREGLGVLRRVDALVQLAIDRNGARAGDERTEGAAEERGLGEEPDVASGRCPDDGGIEERIGMVGQEEHGPRSGTSPMRSVR